MVDRPCRNGNRKLEVLYYFEVGRRISAMCFESIRVEFPSRLWWVCAHCKKKHFEKKIKKIGPAVNRIWN